jgi:tryptophanyl-tRNA synthetase
MMTVPGIDGQKMSKSYGNTIPLFAEDDEEIKKIVMSIVTDSKSPDEPKDPDHDNIFALHKLVTKSDELEDLRERYKTGKISYKESKEILLKNMLAFIAPLREKRLEAEKMGDSLLDILEEGKQKVGEIAEEKMNEVRNKVGLTN